MRQQLAGEYDLLDYFGETMTDTTYGNCDICHHPPEVWDGTLAAQKTLSCIYRTGQYFGTEHLIDVLQGNPTDRVKQYGHDNVSIQTKYLNTTTHEKRSLDPESACKNEVLLKRSFVKKNRGRQFESKSNAFMLRKYNIMLLGIEK